MSQRTQFVTSKQLLVPEILIAAKVLLLENT